MPPPDLLSDVFLFRALMENEVDSIYFKDRQCRLLRVSQKMADSLGFSDPAELIGKTDIDLFGEAFGRGTRLDDIGIMETGRPVIGVIESLSGLILGESLGQIGIFLIFIAVLLVRPSGLFGARA